MVGEVLSTIQQCERTTLLVRECSSTDYQVLNTACCDLVFMYHRCSVVLVPSEALVLIVDTWYLVLLIIV